MPELQKTKCAAISAEARISGHGAAPVALGKQQSLSHSSCPSTKRKSLFSRVSVHSFLDHLCYLSLFLVLRHVRCWEDLNRLWQNGIYIHVYRFINACVYTCIYAYICMYKYVYVCACIYICMYIYLHARAHSHTRAHTCTLAIVGCLHNCRPSATQKRVQVHF